MHIINKNKLQFTVMSMNIFIFCIELYNKMKCSKVHELVFVRISDFCCTCVCHMFLCFVVKSKTVAKHLLLIF